MLLRLLVKILLRVMDLNIDIKLFKNRKTYSIVFSQKNRENPIKTGISRCSAAPYARLYVLSAYYLLINPRTPQNTSDFIFSIRPSRFRSENESLRHSTRRTRWARDQ